MQLAWWTGQPEIIELTKLHLCPPPTEFPLSGLRTCLPHHFQSLSLQFPAHFGTALANGASMLCDIYGQTHLKEGRLKCALAWLSMSVMLHPYNINIQSDQEITHHKKGCDNCGVLPVVGYCHTCVVCQCPHYDLCDGCFSKRKNLGHRHSRFLRIPGRFSTVPSFSECCSNLLTVIAEECANDSG